MIPINYTIALKIFTQGNLLVMFLFNGMDKTLQKVDKRWNLVHAGQTEEKGPSQYTFEFEGTHNYICYEHFVITFVGLEHIFVVQGDPKRL